MAQLEDILVKILNLDAEIRYCMAHLADVAHGAHERVHPWIDEDRSSLLVRMERLKKRREIHFLALNTLISRRATNQFLAGQPAGTRSMPQAAIALELAKSQECQ
ncbi:hypothetical protein [Paraburkholderia mimosarum]|uniref:hypothetical protein n=1 Tax=Paraburkholderia mimosarum TaxID=312026 RepID=UPI0004018828|nr:hypothetical protein [Paraburkholderia mimosarum]